ncbi:MAG: adenylyltransferase/cytidyltransferase family protein [Bacteroidetes bacterium]|nr:adenylyltransferase/cytidyltransferase family protein [Bacteroidota bacterium]
MIDKSYISNRLQKLGFLDTVVNRYEEPHRFYHTTAHLVDVVQQLSKVQDFDDELFLAAVYHDAIYDPQSFENEERSANLFLEEAEKTKLTKAQKDSINLMILDTKKHDPSNDKSQLLIKADLNILDQPLDKLIEYEHQIFKEYQFVDYKVYQPKRIEVLKNLNINGKLNSLIDYVTHRKPLIGIFCGSFNPFHKGHYNVLQKAERIFDKVIISFGKNPDKKDRTWDIPNSIKNRELTEYSGLLTDHIESFAYEVIVVRGLRNSTDFQYEQNQYRYIQELMPQIKIINVFCDKEFEHISSSGIRTLEKYNKHQSYLLD